MRFLMCLLLICCACKGAKLGYFAGVEHLEAHKGVVRTGVSVKTERNKWRVYYAPTLDVRDHPSFRVNLDYSGGFGVMWERDG